MHSRALIVACPVLAAVALLGGCGSYPLHANLDDAELHTRLDQYFHAGMTVDGVRGELSSLRVREGDTLLYPKTSERPEVLLARLFPPGGFWIDATTESVEFVDVSFVFGDARTLERWVTFRDSIRYFEGEAVKGPSREPMTRVPNYPGKPPPPVDPLGKT